MYFLRITPPAEQPSSLIITPPEWLPPREVPTGEVPPSPLGMQRTLRVVSFRSESPRVYGLGAISVFERGATVAFEVYLPPAANGSSYAAWIARKDGSLLPIGTLASQSNGWFAAAANFSVEELESAQGLRITRITTGENGPGESIVSGTLSEVLP